MTGPIIVEDAIYENGDSDGSGPIPLKDSVFRRLTFERSLGLVQSEALLVRQECTEKSPGEMEWKKTISSKSRKKGSRRKNNSRTSSIDGNGALASMLFVWNLQEAIRAAICRPTFIFIPIA
ncbi:uncharacterized protein LOC131240120 [Magnolia sinica]|uniref:uncharacterized protein LOC131240120 n=1 Tax=Magnolia sinica TaxID=86752 RepID=UPI002659DEBF|nr:uncharacterized protein LOC131240120 [Magnolia sinica]XP_058094158.1 uncharacterized protein LOC131240120 [Magnolia sinica]XP_058094159.1 uncharacterized protein LOC131240120 [Magnolia sinica]